MTESFSCAHSGRGAAQGKKGMMLRLSREIEVSSFLWIGECLNLIFFFHKDFWHGSVAAMGFYLTLNIYPL